MLRWGPKVSQEATELQDDHCNSLHSSVVLIHYFRIIITEYVCRVKLVQVENSIPRSCAQKLVMSCYLICFSSLRLSFDLTGILPHYVEVMGLKLWLKHKHVYVFIGCMHHNSLSGTFLRLGCVIPKKYDYNLKK